MAIYVKAEALRTAARICIAFWSGTNLGLDHYGRVLNSVGQTVRPFRGLLLQVITNSQEINFSLIIYLLTNIFSHLLYSVYFFLIVIHAPNCIMFMALPLSVFVIEVLYRGLSMCTRSGRGSSIIEAGIVLPSRVTGLVIRRPDRFHFSPGDWVFIKVPSVAAFEWHPFTISSSPEQKVCNQTPQLKK